MAEQYSNIRIILDKIMRHPLLQDVTLETVVDYTVDFMRLVGVPTIFEEKVEKVHICEYRAPLPCDYYQMIQIRRADKHSPAFRYSTDDFHMSDCKTEYPDLTYKIQGRVIFFSLKDGDVELSYEAIATDSDGFPIIPDNSSFTRALELFIKKQWFTILFDLGKISAAVLQNTQREYAFAVGDCQCEFNRLTIDKAEAFYNSWRTLIIRDTEHKSGFRLNGTKERLKLQ
ncbi:MAG: hypothetical protein HUJ56_09655 [Erysipelotrichaceae bacterium]|nr:hypothetical protein [Erysipelotrichaceae bacterium]